MEHSEKVNIINYSELSGQGSRWSREEEFLLFKGTESGKSTAELSNLHNRTEIAIITRQLNLGLRWDPQSGLIEPLPIFAPTTDLRLGDIRSATPKNSQQAGKKLNQFPETIGFNEKEISSDPVQALWEAIKKDIFNLKTSEKKEREIKILLSRLDPDPAMGKVDTLQDLGREFRITKERVRQISKKGKRKLFQANHLQNKNLGRVIKNISSSNDLDDKSDTQIIDWYFALFLSNRCLVEFASGIFTSINKVHNIRGLSIKSLMEKYSNGLSTLRTDQKKQVKKEYSRQKQVKSANDFVMSVLKKAKFSGTFAHNLDSLTMFRPLRNVQNERTFFSESLKKLIQWESHGELKLIKAMEKSSIIKDFVEQPIEIDYEFNGQRKYIPDFMIRTEEGLIFVLEVKFRKQLADARVLAKSAAATQYLGALGVGYCLVDEEGFSTNDLKNVAIPENFKSILRNTLEKKRIVNFSDLYRYFDGPPKDLAFDQIQSLAFLYPNQIQYLTNLERTYNNEKPFKFGFQLSWI